MLECIQLPNPIFPRQHKLLGQELKMDILYLAPLKKTDTVREQLFAIC